MKRFLLPTFDYKEDHSRASYSMEHLVVPDVALQLVHDALSTDGYIKLIENFFAFIRDRSCRTVGREAVLEAGRRQIAQKMHDRLDQLLSTATGKRLDTILTASGPFGGLRDMEVRSAELIDAALRDYQGTELAVSHGDPCFSNILFDAQIGLFRLIDPRGAEEASAAEMHPLYDIAKFSHSILGGYDFVNSDLFDCKYDADLGLYLSVDHSGIDTVAQTAFGSQVKKLGISLRNVRSVELSLFMSMLPLHADHPRKLLGFALIACRVIEELEHAEGGKLRKAKQNIPGLVRGRT